MRIPIQDVIYRILAEGVILLATLPSKSVVLNVILSLLHAIPRDCSVRFTVSQMTVNYSIIGITILAKSR